MASKKAKAVMLVVAGYTAGLMLFVTGCKPRSTAERIEDKTEDAAHETKLPQDP